MNVTKITVGVKRDVRHRPYEVSRCECTLEANLDPPVSDEQLEAAYKELHSDVLVIVAEMVEEEKNIYKERRR